MDDITDHEIRLSNFLSRDDIVGSDLLIIFDDAVVSRGPIVCVQLVPDDDKRCLKIIPEWMAQFDPIILQWVLLEEDEGALLFDIRECKLDEENGVIDVIYEQFFNVKIVLSTVSTLRREDVVC